MQADGLAGGCAVVTLVEAACLVDSLYFLGGSNHHPGGEVGTDHNRNKAKLTSVEKETMEEVLPLQGKGEPALTQTPQFLDIEGRLNTDQKRGKI